MLFFDLEINKNNKIVDIGSIYNNFKFRDSDIKKFIKFNKKHKPSFYAGHNIVNFDLKYLKDNKIKGLIRADNVIDTLYLSALLFPKKPYHNLVKDDKLVSDYSNNPLNDSIKSKNLFYDSLNQFNKLDDELKDIYYLLLNDKIGFFGFFEYIKYKETSNNLEELIMTRFENYLCFNKNIKSIIDKYPVEFAYSLSYINSINKKESEKSLVPPWLLNNYSNIENILAYLRNKPCNKNDCNYCNNNLSALDGLKYYFDYPSFRKFDGISLQYNAVNSALNEESLIAVFPTGGGKSLTFQLPALMAGENIRGLTVVISPLLSLMKDQVDNLYKKGITTAAYINSLLNPIERKDTIDRVLNGNVDILYIAPESLRSRTIERLLLKRQVVRFVIDEAHCFSTWGHDFRVDYLYIGDFIKNLMKKKELTRTIPVSCFTATAKQDVIDDIKNYFNDKLDLSMKIFKTESGRKNLEYNVIKVDEEEDRYYKLRNLLEGDSSPTIIYASRTKIINKLHERLNKDNFKASKFHGKMDNDEKILNQNEFMEGKTNIMVATNAFGMGVDKDDVKVVIHFNISDSLENYVQEAGRAGRDEKINANCYILYNENDLDQHFELLRNSKISRNEIAQVWTGIKKETNKRDNFTKTSLEIAKLTGWDIDQIHDVETRVKTSILALEDANLIKRGMNSPKVFATSLLVKNMTEAIKLIESSILYTNDDDKTVSKRIVSSLISNKRKSWTDELAEARIDYLSDRLGINKRIIIRNINLLKESKVLADDKDLYAKINDETVLQTLITSLNRYKEMFNYLINEFSEERKAYNLKVLNENFINKTYKPNIKYLRIALNYLKQTNGLDVNGNINRNFYAKLNTEKDKITNLFNSYFNIAEFTIKYLFNKHKNNNNLKTKSLIDFSVVELKDEYQKSLGLFGEDISTNNIEHVILMLQRLDVLSFEGGFLVSYVPLTIKRIEKNNLIRYTVENYSKLKKHYENKNEQIHIVGRYAELMSIDKEEANKFVSDYFNLYYNAFLDKHFPGKMKKEIDLKMSKKRYELLFGKLSDEQKEIVEDDKNKIIGVAAGPGSGKTTLLVHKLASIIYNEDIRLEQLLMLTFSRAAAVEFKERLKELVGNVANYIQITTFHSYAFDLVGKLGSLEHSQNIINEAYQLIKNNEADTFKITKMVLVIDEAQDISLDEYNLLNELIKFNDDIRVLAVGDDDQNIYEFRGSNSIYLKEFAKNKQYELTRNFRSKNSIVEYSNKLISLNKNRMKTKEIKSYTNQKGNIDIVNYKSNNLIEPLIKKLIEDKPKGTTAIITRTNEEALLVSGVLNELNIENRLIQDILNIKSYNVFELRQFYLNLERKTESKIDTSIWKKLIEEFEYTFKYSKSINSSLNILNKFIEVYDNPYLTDLYEYLIETNIGEYTILDKIVVANLHKVKGMEFDNVYLMYEYSSNIEEESLRALYVGITRAKNNLNIHTTSNLFTTIKTNNINLINDASIYNELSTINLLFGYDGVNLGYFEFLTKNIKKLMTGDILSLKDNTLYKNNRKIALLSKKGRELLNNRIENGYKIKEISVSNIVFWYNKEKEKEVLIVLPMFKFNKTTLGR